jgi:hypothetical protein
MMKHYDADNGEMAKPEKDPLRYKRGKLSCESFGPQNDNLACA